MVLSSIHRHALHASYICQVLLTATMTMIRQHHSSNHSYSISMKHHRESSKQSSHLQDILPGTILLCAHQAAVAGVARLVEPTLAGHLSSFHLGCQGHAEAQVVGCGAQHSPKASCGVGKPGVHAWPAPSPCCPKKSHKWSSCSLAQDTKHLRSALQPV